MLEENIDTKAKVRQELRSQLLESSDLAFAIDRVEMEAKGGVSRTRVPHDSMPTYF